MSDTELNRLFAERVAGWKNLPTPKGGGWWYDENDSLQVDGPRFVESADAVLPWLEKADGLPWISYRHAQKAWEVEIDIGGEVNPWGAAPTFAKAAVLALLRAKGVEA